MATEPSTKRVFVLFDGQNLFNAAKEAFGYYYPNYDPVKLAHAVAQSQGWQVAQIAFYTGVPSPIQDSARAGFWRNKLNVLRSQGVSVFQGQVRYHLNQIKLPDGSTQAVQFGYEKGVDVQIAIDALTVTRLNRYDVVLLFSQDQDLQGLGIAIRLLAKEEERWIKIASAFPVSTSSRNRRGINNTDWLPFDKTLYDVCIDPKDYRPK